MREILEMCVELDRTAAVTYEELARLCTDAELGTTFAKLAKEERQHVEWWSELLAAWDAGLVPDIADEHGLLQRLKEIRNDLAASLPDDLSLLDEDGMLDLAVRFEFFMLDHAFSELTELMQPGGHAMRHEAYFRHVTRLIEAVEAHHSQRRLAGFLAHVLLKVYRDQQRMASLAVRDQLTGLYNRRGLLGHLRQWLAWSARYGRPLAVILVDVDEFKRVNDVHGHMVGDRSLRLVADALRGGVRTSDVLGRFGGDEFLVLAPETDRGELQQLMERLITCVRDSSAAAQDLPDLTVSVGGSWTNGGIAIEPEVIIAAADASLYEAKADGRDRAGAPRSFASVD